MKKLKIALDLDDTIFDFFGEYKKVFPGNKNLIDSNITKNVYKLKRNKQFWENLPVLEKPNFEPFIYATKRINSKTYTKNCLIKHGLPVKPIYQIYCQTSNKADYIKGICDVLIDDSITNVMQAINSGLPALLIDRPHNQNSNPVFRIYNLDINEILDAYELELQTLQWK